MPVQELGLVVLIFVFSIVFDFATVTCIENILVSASVIDFIACFGQREQSPCSFHLPFIPELPTAQLLTMTSELFTPT